MSDTYYIDKVDEFPETVYCHHRSIDERFIPPHAHRFKGQFLYTEGGIVHVKTDSHNFYLPARHAMWIAPGMTHSIHPSNQEVIMHNFYFPITPQDKRVFSKTAIYPINDLLLQLMRLSQSWPNGNLIINSPEYHIAIAFKEIFAFTAGVAVPLALPIPTNERLIPVVQFIGDNIQERLSLPQIAEQFNLSVRTLSRLFHQDLSMSFINYTTILRLLKAIELLIASNLPITDIAFLVGYSSAPTFSNIFHHIMGIRPADYRKLRTENQLHTDVNNG